MIGPFTTNLTVIFISALDLLTALGLELDGKRPRFQPAAHHPPTGRIQGESFPSSKEADRVQPRAS